MKRRYLFLLSLSIAPSVFAGAALELPDSSDNPGNRSVLPELNVTESRDARRLSSPVPTQSLDSRKIRTAGITDISDALRRMAGINLRDYGGAGALKTVSVRGLGAQHTSVAYDGVPLTDIRSGEIDLSRYSLDNIDAITLTAGDNSDIFTSARNAAAAASLEISSLPTPDLWQKRLELSARMRFGSFGLYNPFIHIGGSNGRNFAMGATAEFSHSKNDYPFTLVNGALKTRERRTHSRMNSTHGEINAEWKPSTSSSLTAKVYYYDNSRQLPGPVIYYVAHSNEHLHDRNFFAQTRFRTRLSSNFSLKAMAKFNWSASKYEDVNGSYPGGRLDQDYRQKEAYVSGALLYTPLPELSLDYSADWFYNNLSSNLPTDRHPHRNSILQSISAKYTFRRLTAMARCIYSIYVNRARPSSNLSQTESLKPDSKTFSRFSPSLTLSYQPIAGKSLYIRASYKNIFRMPTFNELYFDNYGSAALLPEITDQWNVGVTWSAKGSGPLAEITATADGYINEVKDKIVAIPYNLFKWTMTNLGKARIYGFDATLNAGFSIRSDQSILLSANYSYVRAMPLTSPDRRDYKKQVAYTPLNSGAASLSWINPWVSVAIHATATSARYATNDNIPSSRISGFVEAGAALFHTFRLRSHSLEIRADLLNAFDRQYQLVARYPMPGRSWQASILFSL